MCQYGQASAPAAKRYVGQEEMNWMRRLSPQANSEPHVLHYKEMAWAVMSDLQMQRSHNYSDSLPVHLACFRNLAMARSHHAVTEEEFVHLISIFRNMQSDYPRALTLNPTINFDGPLMTVIGVHDISLLPVGRVLDGAIMNCIRKECGER